MYIYIYIYIDNLINICRHLWGPPGCEDLLSILMFLQHVLSYFRIWTVLSDFFTTRLYMWTVSTTHLYYNVNKGFMSSRFVILLICIYADI
jgi:hypothetical protein